MVYKVSLTLVLYAVSAVLDAYLGITILNPYRSYFLRIAAVVTVVAIFVMLIKKGGTLKIFPFILSSIILSLAAIASGGYTDLSVVAICIKVIATVLTVKPDLIEIVMKI